MDANSQANGAINGHIPGDAGRVYNGGLANGDAARVFELEDHPIEDVRPLKVAVIGAGLSGLIAGALLPIKVPGIELTIIEKNDEVGGTWLENIYPGVRCDIQSHAYQSTFYPKTQWSEEFATGGEILEYWKDFARAFDVYRYIRFRQKVIRTEWDDERGKWLLNILDLNTSKPYLREVDFVVTAIGRFNEWRMPKYPGMDLFAGHLRHSSNWDPAFDPVGKRVALIDNGASGLQLLPHLQRVCQRVDHYARNRTWVTRAWAEDERTFEAQPFSKEQLESFNDPETYLRYRKEIENKYWGGFEKAFRGTRQNEALREESTNIMKQRLKKKPELLDRLVPAWSPICRRPTPGPGYLEALCEDNVDFIQDSIKRFTKTGIETEDGRLREVDAVICATGANIDLVPPFSIVSRGVDLKEAWAPQGSIGFPYTYLGYATPGFPNLLFILGPQAAGLSGTVPHCVENQVAVMAKILRKASSQGIKSIAPKKEAADDFIEYSSVFFQKTVLTESCRSWYNGGIEGGYVHGVWPGSSNHLTIARKNPKWEDFDFEYLSSNRFAYWGNGSTRYERHQAADMTEYLKLPGEVDLRTLWE